MAVSCRNVQSYLSFPHIGQLLLLVLHVSAASRQHQRVFDARLDAVVPEGLPQVRQKVAIAQRSRDANVLIINGKHTRDVAILSLELVA